MVGLFDEANGWIEETVVGSNYVLVSQSLNDCLGFPVQLIYKAVRG